MRREEKILCYCINVFNTTPTFLLPIFKDENNGCYYAQKSDGNKIVDFEEINIEKYRIYSRLYNVDTYVKYGIDSDTVYSIDYETGFLFGNREIIVSFYRNNTNLFNDKFMAYMSDFIAINQDIIKNTNFALIKRFSDNIFDNSKFNNFCKNINCINLLNDYSHKIENSYNISQHVRYLRYRRKREYKLTNFCKNYLRDFYFNKNSLNSRLFKELFKKPPIYNLWNDRIINGFTSFKNFCNYIGIDASFPDNMFKNHIFWKEAQLSKEVNEKYNAGYSVFYIQIKKISTNSNIIISQDYYTKRNYIRFYTNEISSYDFIGFSIDLIEDVMKKICLIMEEQNISFLLDNYFIEQIKLYDINLIIPPNSKYQRVKNKIWW